jgi:uncharacterized protein YfdQ (DUF2303 family)
MKENTAVQADGIVAEVRDLVEGYVKAEVIEITEPETGVKALAIRAGNGVTPLAPTIFDPFRDEPRRRQGTATMLSLDSLIDHVNRFKDDGSIVFADDNRDQPSITAVIDYHPKGQAVDVMPRFGKHRSVFAFPVSDEWKAWTSANEQKMDMPDFAAYLENRLPDVLWLETEDVLPEDLDRLVNTLGGRDTIATPNKLMELARGLQVNENSIVQEAVNLASGEGVIRFQVEHADASGAPLKVPQIFLIAIPVFRNGPLYRIAARLRYRKSAGRLVFWFELWRTDRTFDHAFSEAVDRVKVDTSLPVLIGRPEAA